MDEPSQCPFCGEMPQVSKEGIAMHACRVLDREIRVPVAAWNRRAERTCHLIDCPPSTCARKEGWATWPKCSECGEAVRRKANYCSNCGAKVVDE